MQLTAIGLFADSSSKDISGQVSWLSTDTNILSINSTGRLTAIAVGSTNIQVSLNGIHAQLQVKVIAPPVAKLTAVEISAIPELTAGTTLQLTAIGVFDDGVHTNITEQVRWLSHNSDIVTISATGLLTAVSAGSTTIQAELSGIRTQLQVNVLASPPSKLTAIEISAIPELTSGYTLQLTATGFFDDGSRANITNQVNWLSNNPDVLTISTTGLLTTHTAGSTSIQASLSGIIAQATLTVAPAPLVAIELQPLSDMTAGTALQLTAIGLFADNSRKDITAQVSWLSTDTDILTINTTGLLTAIAVGSTNIQASFNGIHAQQQVNVLAPPVAELTAIEISAIAELTAGATLQLTATGLFDDGSRANITNQVSWLVTNPDILSINTTGLLTTHAAGSTSIQAALLGISVQTSVNVAPATTGRYRTTSSS